MQKVFTGILHQMIIHKFLAIKGEFALEQGWLLDDASRGGSEHFDQLCWSWPTQKVLKHVFLTNFIQYWPILLICCVSLTKYYARNLFLEKNHQLFWSWPTKRGLKYVIFNRLNTILNHLTTFLCVLDQILSVNVVLLNKNKGGGGGMGHPPPMKQSLLLEIWFHS